MVATPIVVARDYIVRNPSASNVEVARQTGASLRTVSSARQELRRLGVVKPAYGDRGQSAQSDGTVLASSVLPEATTEGLDVQSHTDLETAVRAELARSASAESEDEPPGEPTPAALKKVLWRVMHRNVDDRVVVAAVSALGRILAEADSRPLGPGVPMTRHDVKARLKRLFKACGVSVVTEALNEWIEEANEGQLAVVSGEATQGIVGVAPTPGS